MALSGSPTHEGRELYDDIFIGSSVSGQLSFRSRRRDTARAAADYIAWPRAGNER